ncbi:UNVERIFIED_CONTAM: hypothetical protein K2H54_040859 [Gekko kuhli]
MESQWVGLEGKRGLRELVMPHHPSLSLMVTLALHHSSPTDRPTSQSPGLATEPAEAGQNNEALTCCRAAGGGVTPYAPPPRSSPPQMALKTQRWEQARQPGSQREVQEAAKSREQPISSPCHSGECGPKKVPLNGNSEDSVSTSGNPRY